MAKGEVKDLFPPGNNGSRAGAGQINEKDANGNLKGPPYRIFQTPQDVQAGATLSVGKAIAFTPVGNAQATGVAEDGDIVNP